MAYKVEMPVILESSIIVIVGSPGFIAAFYQRTYGHPWIHSIVINGMLSEKTRLNKS
jgi:hypothetical protein